MPFFIIFVIIPLIEIALFISVGEEIGIGATLFLCFLTALIGAGLIRTQGIKTLASAQQALARNKMPVAELFDGLCLFLAGAVLVTPGFFTDAVGFFLLVPPFRRWLRRRLTPYVTSKSYKFTSSSFSSAEEQAKNESIDVEYERIDTVSEQDNDANNS